MGDQFISTGLGAQQRHLCSGVGLTEDCAVSQSRDSWIRVIDGSQLETLALFVPASPESSRDPRAASGPVDCCPYYRHTESNFCKLTLPGGSSFSSPVTRGSHSRSFLPRGEHPSTDQRKMKRRRRRKEEETEAGQTTNYANPSLQFHLCHFAFCTSHYSSWSRESLPFPPTPPPPPRLLILIEAPPAECS